MPTIKERVQEEVKNAMRAQDKERLGILRLIMSDFKRVEVDERIELDETRTLAILDKMQKQRRDSIAEYKKAGREELAAKEQFEIDVIQTFKPAAMSDDEIGKVVSQTIQETGASSAKDMGKVMNALKPKLQGRADMVEVSAKVKALLAGG